MPKRRPVDEAEANSLLKKRGYTVTKRTKYTLKTVEIEDDVLKEFTALYERLGVTRRIALNIAIREWVEKYRHKK